MHLEWPKSLCARTHIFPLTARSKTSCSPREGTRPTRFPRKSPCIVGPVPSPGGFFNGLLGIDGTERSALQRIQRRLHLLLFCLPFNEPFLVLFQNVRRDFLHEVRIVEVQFRLLDL